MLNEILQHIEMGNEFRFGNNCTQFWKVIKLNAVTFKKLYRIFSQTNLEK